MQSHWEKSHRVNGPLIQKLNVLFFSMNYSYTYYTLNDFLRRYFLQIFIQARDMIIRQAIQYA